MPSLNGHNRRKETVRDELTWNNQVIQVADCAGSSASRLCAWHKSGSAWEHVTSPAPTYPFRLGKKK